MNSRIISIKPISFDMRAVVRLIKCNCNVILLLSMFACGLIIGTVCIQLSDNYRILFNAIFFVKNEILHIFLNRVLMNLTVLTVNFVMGLCLVGTPFISLMSVADGIYVGSMYSLQLFENGFENIVKFILSQCVFYVLSYMVLLYSQILSLKMSDAIKVIYCDVGRGEILLRSYLLRYVCILMISTIISFVSSLFA